MNTINRTVKYVLIALLPVATACNDWLDFNPETELSEAQVWKTPKDFKSATGDLYLKLDHPKYQTDYKADILVEGSRDVVNDEQKGNIQVSESEGTWNSNYAYIRDANTILKKAETYQNPDELALYVAEARFFRAYFYYKLFEEYGGVPVITKVLDVGSEELYKPRDTREYTFNFILTQLNEAIPELPLQGEIDAVDYGRLSRQAAMAFRARICLREGTWRKYRNQADSQQLIAQAVLDATDIMAVPQYEIFDHPGLLGVDSYKYLFLLEDEECNPSPLRKKDNKEFLLARRYNSSINKIGAANRGFAPTRKFIDMFVCTNGLPIRYNNGVQNPQFMGYKTKTSEFVNRDHRMTSLVRQDGIVYYGFGEYGRWGNPKPPTEPYANNFGSGSSTGYFCDKFSSERYVENGGEGFDYPIIRYAEVLLIFAEATYEKNGVITDDELNRSVNQLRKRGGIANLTNELVNANGLNMLDEIRRERTVELYFEGFRLDDLKRWNMAKQVMTEDICGFYLGTGTPWGKFSRGKDKDDNGFYRLCKKEDRRWEGYYDLKPIPYDQLRLSKCILKQNPGYDSGSCGSN